MPARSSVRPLAEALKRGFVSVIGCPLLDAGRPYGVLTIYASAPEAFGATEVELLSHEVYRIFGLPPQEFGVTYEAFLEAVHPEDRAAVTAAYSGSVQAGKDTYEIEHRVIKKDTGEVRTVHEKCLHVKDASGRIVRSIGMVHDITELKRHLLFLPAGPKTRHLIVSIVWLASFGDPLLQESGLKSLT